MRAYSDCVPMAPIITLCTHRDWYPARQISQVLSEATNDPTTKSPTFTFFTAAPISVTTPTYSWPIGCGVTATAGAEYGHRSDPQMHDADGG